jgi:hypothetical protein
MNESRKATTQATKAMERSGDHERTVSLHRARHVVGFVVALTNVKELEGSIAPNVLAHFPPVDGSGSDVPHEGVRFLRAQQGDHFRLTEHLDIAVTVQRSGDAERLGSAQVSNINAVGGLLTLEEGLGVCWALVLDGRVGKHGEFVGENGLVEHGVPVVFVRMIEAEFQIPTVPGENVWRGRGVNHQLDGVGRDPRLTGWKR